MVSVQLNVVSVQFTCSLDMVIMIVIDSLYATYNTIYVV